MSESPGLSELIGVYKDSGSGDFLEWVEKLELVAQLQKVKKLTSFVPLFLSGPAFAVYKQLPRDSKDDYDLLKAGLVAAFSASPFEAYEELKGRVLKGSESVDVYLADLRRLIELTGKGYLSLY